MSQSSSVFIWLKPFNRRVLFLSVLVSITFWICSAFPPFAGRFILKASPILALALMVWNHRQSQQEALLFAGIIFHSLGDMLLDIDRAGLFLPALVTFLIGHIFYILTLIAVNTFVQPFAASAFLIWPLYYLGQFLIVMGFLREKHS